MRLGRWLDEHHTVEPNLAASTGPVWTLGELLAFLEDDEHERLLDAPVYYPPATGGAELRDAVAGMAGVAPEHVQITTGAAEALWIVFLGAAEPGANVVLPQPGFPTFAEAPRVLGLETRRYRLRREDDYRLDLDEIRSLTDARTRVILVNSPHNPTGATLSEAEQRALHELAVERGIQLVVDEVYHPIHHGAAPASATLLPGATVLGDFSKALCLSGLRLGWIVDRDPVRREGYADARAYLTASATSMGEALGVAAVRNRDRIFARAREVVTANLRLLTGFMAEHADRFAWVPPRGGMTAFPWLRSGESARPYCEEAAGRGVLLAPGDCFGEPSHFRLGFGAAGDRFAEGLDALQTTTPSRPASPASSSR